MLKIEKWAADKPIWLAMLSHQVVSAMDALYYLCQLASDETLISNQMHPDIFDKWVSLYSNPQGVYRESAKLSWCG